MPIYEFKCTKCEEFFEVIVMAANDNDAVACPKCESKEFERVVSKLILQWEVHLQGKLQEFRPRKENVQADHVKPIQFQVRQNRGVKFVYYPKFLPIQNF